MVSAAREKAQQLVNENGVVVFSKSYCPYCQRSKQLLEKKGAKMVVLELDEMEDGDDIQNALKEMNGQRTVPNIYIGKEHIGGNSDLQAIPPNKLDEMLTKAGAV